MWRDCNEKDVSETRRPPKRRRKRKVLSSSEPTTTDEEENVDQIPPKRSKRRSMAEKAERCGDAVAAEGSDEFDEFVRNLSHGTSLLLPKHGTLGLDLDSLVKSAMEEILAERLLGV